MPEMAVDTSPPSTFATGEPAPQRSARPMVAPALPRPLVHAVCASGPLAELVSARALVSQAVVLDYAMAAGAIARGVALQSVVPQRDHFWLPM